MVYSLLFPNGAHLPNLSYIDVRDVARAHVGALDSKPDKKDRKRVLMFSPHALTPKLALDIIKQEHPELEPRLLTAPPPEFPFDKYDIDFERIKEITGIRKEDFHTLEQVSHAV